MVEETIKAMPFSLPLSHINPAQITDVGTNTHAQIDTHIASMLNPHTTTLQAVFDAEPGVDRNIVTTDDGDLAIILDNDDDMRIHLGGSIGDTAAFKIFRGLAEGTPIFQVGFDVNAVIAGTWLPNGLNVDIGSGVALWRDVFLSRNLSDGTDSLTIANAKAAFDHIHNLTTDIDHDTITNTHNLTTDISHDSIADVSADDHHAETHTIASHDTSATGAELDSLTDNSVANALHRHSELVASDGTPDPALSVDADGKVTGVNMLLTGGLEIKTASGNSATMILNEGDVESVAIRNDATANDLRFMTTNGGTLVTKMMINQAGLVGIGTAAPRDKVHVKMPGTGGYFTLQSNSIAEGSDVRLGFSLTTAEANEAKTYIQATRGANVNLNDLKFVVGDTEAMMIKDSGRVGIGVSDPHSKLEVNGAISSETGTLITSSDTADVSGRNTLFVDTQCGDITVGGLRGGVNGQSLNIVIIGNFTNSLFLEHNEGIAGSQDLFMHTGADEEITAGGMVFVCNGTNWYDTSHAKHV